MNRKKLTLIAFFIVLLGPMIAAAIVLHFKSPQELKLNHHGTLISPMQNVSQFQGLDQLKGKWWLTYVAPEKCFEDCHNTLYNLRQIRVALGKNMNRCERLFIVNPKCPKSVCEDYLGENYKDMHKVTLPQPEFDTLIQATPQLQHTLGAIYIIDPKGNAMMRYDIETPPKEILTDMKKLLRNSKI